MNADESVVIVGNRRTLPHVKINTEIESDRVSLRQRYSSGGSSNGGSSSSPNCVTPPSSTSTPHQKTSRVKRFGTPGCMSSYYGSFQPSSYTDAYIPPLSVKNQDFNGAYQVKTPAMKNLDEEFIKIDSGYGCSSSPRYSSSSNNYGVNQSLRSSADQSWDPVKNVRRKLIGKPSFIDESSSRKFRMQPQQILACLVFAIIITCLGFIAFITCMHFKNTVKEESNSTNIEYDDNSSYIMEMVMDEDELSSIAEDDILYGGNHSENTVNNSLNDIIVKGEEFIYNISDINEAQALQSLAKAVIEVLNDDTFNEEIQNNEGEFLLPESMHDAERMNIVSMEINVNSSDNSLVKDNFMVVKDGVDVYEQKKSSQRKTKSLNPLSNYLKTEKFTKIRKKVNINNSNSLIKDTEPFKVTVGKTPLALDSTNALNVLNGSDKLSVEARNRREADMLESLERKFRKFKDERQDGFRKQVKESKDQREK